MISCFIWSRSKYNFILWQILLTHSLKALSVLFLIRWSVLIKFQVKRCDEFLLWNYRHKDKALESSNRCCRLRFAENNFKVARYLSHWLFLSVELDVILTQSTGQNSLYFGISGMYFISTSCFWHAAALWGGISHFYRRWVSCDEKVGSNLDYISVRSRQAAANLLTLTIILKLMFH